MGYLRVHFAVIELGVHDNNKVGMQAATPGQVLGDNDDLYGAAVEQLGDDLAVCVGEALV